MGLFDSKPKGLNLKDLLSLLQGQFNSITFTEKSRTEDKVEITADIVAKKYFDDGIALRVVAYKSGPCHVFMTFDKLDPSFENYDMINTYNDHSSFLAAYISQKNGGKYLEIHGSSMDAPSVKVLSDTVTYLINELLNEKLLNYLQPITKNTY